MHSEWSKKDFKKKLNLWMVYNPDFMAHSLSSHGQSLSQKPGLYTLSKNFKKILFSKTLPYSLRMI